MRVVGLEWEPVNQLLANPMNFRRHPGAQRDALRAAFRELGFAGALLKNRTTGHLIDGHARAEELLTMDEQQEVPVVVVEMSEAEELLLLSTYDPIGAMAVADKDALDAILREVDTGEAALQKMLADLAKENGLYLDTPTIGAGGDEFDAAPIEGPTRSKPGDLWLVDGGRHRVLCGDATKREDVERVMGGERAALCLTDPPYGVGFTYESTDDTQANLARLIDGFLPIARSHSEYVLLTPGNSNQWMYPRPDWCMAWVVPAGAGRGPHGFTCWQPVLAYGKDPWLARGLGSRPDVLVKTESAPDLAHPCPKPLEVWEWWLKRGSTAEGDVVYDPFLGSGTTLIAAHRERRRCFGIEIEPRYVDVILRRAEAEGLSVEKASD